MDVEAGRRRARPRPCGRGTLQEHEPLYVENHHRIERSPKTKMLFSKRFAVRLVIPASCRISGAFRIAIFSLYYRPLKAVLGLADTSSDLFLMEANARGDQDTWDKDCQSYLLGVILRLEITIPKFLVITPTNTRSKALRGSLAAHLAYTT